MRKQIPHKIILHACENERIGHFDILNTYTVISNDMISSWKHVFVIFHYISLLVFFHANVFLKHIEKDFATNSNHFDDDITRSS